MTKTRIKRYSVRWYAERLGISPSHAHRLLDKYAEEGGSLRPSIGAITQFARQNAYYSNRWYDSAFYLEGYSP